MGDIDTVMTADFFMHFSWGKEFPNKSCFPKSRHSSESWNPGFSDSYWMPVFTGMTKIGLNQNFLNLP
jgi:hypothetical protein